MKPQPKSNITLMPRVIPGATDEEAPHSYDLERSMLAAMFTYPGFAQRSIAEFGEHDVWYYKTHKFIFDAIVKTVKDDVKPDTVTVMEQLKADGYIKLVGCQPSDITQLLVDYRTEQSGMADLNGYIYRMKDYYQRWQQLIVADELKRNARDMSTDPKETHYNAIETLSRSGEFILSDVFSPLSVSLQRHADHTEQSGNKRMVFPTGILSIDDCIEGLEKQKVCVIGGRKQNGKTSLSLSMALNIARVGGRVVIFNVADGTEHDVMSRLIAMESGLPYKSVRRGKFDMVGQNGRYIEAMAKMSKLDLTVRSVKGMTMKQLYAEARGLAGVNGIDLIVIDYIQRITVDTTHPKAPRDRVAQLEYISQSITKVAETLDTAVIVAAQINRDGDGKMPDMSHLKGSGAIEEDADMVMLVHRPSVYNPNHPYPQQIQVKIAANKQDGILGQPTVEINPQSTYVISK